MVTVGTAQQVIPGDLVTLSGSATDVDSTTLTHTWSQTSGTTVALTGADTATATFTAPAVNEDLVFQLAVSDGAATSTGSVTVTVAIPPAVWEKLFSGPGHIMATQTGETLWAWGANNKGQLGLGDYTNRTYPVVISNNSTWLQAAMGDYHTLAILTDGTLWAWGYGASGLLGLGNDFDGYSPALVDSATDWAKVQAGSNHSLALNSNGALFATGANGNGQLGDNGGLADSNILVAVDSANTYSDIAAGGNHNLAIRSNGTLWAWGYNFYGQLGVAAGDRVDRLAPTQVGSSNQWKAVWAGDNESFGIPLDGSLWAWGNNNFGQLGLNNTTLQTEPQLVSTGPWAKVHVTSSQSNWGYTLGLQTDGTLWGWGRNNVGQQGLGDTTDRLVPTQVDTTGFSGQVVEIGGSNPNNGFTSMFSLILLDDGTLWRTSTTDYFFSIEVVP